MNTIRDAECRDTSPVMYGYAASPVYGLGKRITPRHPGKRGTPYAESIHLPERFRLKSMTLLLFYSPAARTRLRHTSSCWS